MIDMVRTLRLSLIEISNFLRPLSVIWVWSKYRCFIVLELVNKQHRSETTLSLTVGLSLRFSVSNLIYRFAISITKWLMSFCRRPVPERSSVRRVCYTLMNLMIAGFVAVGILMPLNDNSLMRFNIFCCLEIFGIIWSLMMMFRESSASMAICSSMARKLILLKISLVTLRLTWSDSHRCCIFFFEITELEMSSSFRTLFSESSGTRWLTSLVLKFF